MSVAEHYDKSPHQLRTELRKANIDLEIMRKKLAAAQAKIAMFEATRELATKLIEEDEPSCP